MFFKSSHKQSSDEELMLLLSKGNKHAFEEIYERYSQKLFHFFYKTLGKDRELANDMVQSLFLIIIEKKHLYNASFKVSTWLYTMASNLCKNEFRRQRIRNIVKTDIDISEYHYEKPSIEQSYDHETVMIKIDQIVDSLADDIRLTFILRYKENLSLKEIAEVLGCPEGTIKSRLFNVIQNLSGKLKMYHPNFATDAKR